MIALHRRNRTRARTQDGRPLRRMARRWKVERFFAWLQWQRRVVIRWEFHPENYFGFVQLASLLILVYRYHSDRTAKYNGLQIELQLRTRLQEMTRLLA